MSYDPEKDPEIIAARKQAEQACVDAQAKADAFIRDDKLAGTKGKTPEQVEARKRVVAMFFEQHLPEEKTDAVQAFLDTVDCTQPLVPMNARTVDPQNPRGKRLLGLGRKPGYLLSKQFPPKTDSDPIYALEYYPVNS